MLHELMSPKKRLISFVTMNLDCLEEFHLGLILIEAPTGIEYENQVGGVSCHQARIEGYAIPICGAFLELNQYFTGPKHNGWCNNGIDHADAEFINEFLTKANAEVHVDRNRLDQGQEAWVPIVYGNETGFLTWCNSD